MDAFERIYRTMRQAGADEAQGGALRLRLGRVLSAEPLSVDVSGTTQEATRFYICDRLRREHRETVNLLGGSGGFSANNYTHGVTLDDGTLALRDVTLQQAEPVLQEGDTVLLLTGDDQTFYLIDKVVIAT